MNYDAFSHGQIESKIWLCEELEPFLKHNSVIWVLGSWYNTTALLLHTRKPYFYKMIVGYDNNPLCKDIADKVCAAWTIHAPIRVTNFTADVNELDWSNPPDCVINCSAEHFDSQQWYKNVPNDVLLCIQSTNIDDPNLPWLIKHPSTSFVHFEHNYPMQDKLFHGIHRVKMRSDSSGYDRFMMIGYK